MYQISVGDHFDAAHFLRGYQGKCEALHGHRFQVVVSVQSSVLDDTGMAYDFTELKRHLADILARFDHTCLNDIPPFDRINPSSENIAATIYDELKPKLADAPVTLSGVEVWESPQSRVRYSPD
jgi:6-pyruvoyltetrahydropterin/6-carboxytetrahydropterin synthase